MYTRQIQSSSNDWIPKVPIGSKCMFRIGVVTLLLSTAALAQQTVPGTFTTVSPDSASNAMLPLVSTPTLTLSNGFSPATVTMPQTLATEQPETLVNGGMPQSDFFNTATDQANTETIATMFDFAPVNPDNAFNVGIAGPSLGTIAMRFRKEHVQAHRTYTNDDIDKLTSTDSDNGVISAKLANGQPITDRNQSGFNPASGIANMPGAYATPEGDMLANVPGEDNGTENAENPTTPSVTPGAKSSPQNQQLPASDTNPK